MTRNNKPTNAYLSAQIQPEIDQGGSTMMRKVVLRTLWGLLLVSLLGLTLWASDRITLQGERTIFTATCERGKWEGDHCTGVLAPGDRYAFRASPLRKEVLHWVRGSQAPSGKYTDCTVKDRDNWTCNVHANEPSSVTCEIAKGIPVRSCMGSEISFHQVPKWKWWAMNLGLTIFTDVNT